jgi:hypothetical protein
MRFPWLDGLATLFVAAAVGLYAAFVFDRPIVGFDAVAPVAIAVIVLGIAGCAPAVVVRFRELMSGSRGYLASTVVLGLIATGAGIWAIVAGREEALLGLVIATIVLWAMSTMRHMAVQPAHQGLR